MYFQRLHQRAFSLIELLVSIAVLAVLAVLISIGTQRVSASGRQSKCVSNLRQIGAAALAYAVENNGALPYEVKYRPNPPNPNLPLASLPVDIWTTALNPYIEMPEQVAGVAGLAKPGRDSVYFCPEAKAERDWGGRAPDYGCAVRLLNRPGIDVGVFSRQGWGTEIPAVRLSMIEKPSKVLMLADSYVPDATAPTSLAKGYWALMTGQLTHGSFNTSMPASRLAPRHGYDGKNLANGRFNAVFCDGHVETIAYADPKLKSADYIREMRVPF